MFALLGPIVSGIASLFTGGTSAVSGIAGSLLKGVPIAFWMGMVAGLLITDSKVRDAAIHLGETVIGVVL